MTLTSWRSLTKEERVNLVIEHGVGASNQVTADRIVAAGYNDVTRNAVIGLKNRHREFFPSGGSADKKVTRKNSKPGQRKTTTSKPAKPSPKPSRQQLLATLSDKTGGKNILELATTGECRFPLWGKDIPQQLEDRLYCADPVCVGLNGKKHVYCEAHALVARNPAGMVTP